MTEPAVPAESVETCGLANALELFSLSQTIKILQQVYILVPQQI